jgi:hypothetical protein
MIAEVGTPALGARPAGVERQGLASQLFGYPKPFGGTQPCDALGPVRVLCGSYGRPVAIGVPANVAGDHNGILSRRSMSQTRSAIG